MFVISDDSSALDANRQSRQSVASQGHYRASQPERFFGTTPWASLTSWLRLHPHAGVAREHSARYASPAPDSASSVTSVAIVVPAALHAGFLPDVGPRRLERRDNAGRVLGQRCPEGEHEPLRPALPESAGVPDGVQSPTRRWPCRSAESRTPRLGLRLAHRGAFLCARSILCTRSICSQRISRNSLSRRPVFKSSARAARVCGVRNFWASSSIDLHLDANVKGMFSPSRRRFR